MCILINDDLIDELAMGRARGTEEEAHLANCPECQELVQSRREWIIMFRKAVEQSTAPQTQRRLAQKERSFKPAFRLVKGSR